MQSLEVFQLGICDLSVDQDQIYDVGQVLDLQQCRIGNVRTRQPQRLR